MDARVRVIVCWILGPLSIEEVTATICGFGNTKKFEKKEPWRLLIPQAVAPISFLQPQILLTIDRVRNVLGEYSIHDNTLIRSSRASPFASTSKTRKTTSRSSLCPISRASNSRINRLLKAMTSSKHSLEKLFGIAPSATRLKYS